MQGKVPIEEKTDSGGGDKTESAGWRMEGSKS